MQWHRAAGVGGGVLLAGVALAGVALLAAAPPGAGQPGVVAVEQGGRTIVVEPGPGSGTWVVRGQPDQAIRVQRTPGENVLVRALGGGPQIGVSIGDVEPGGKAEGGAVVRDVTAGSPAEKAGFKTGDVVVEFDGERVRSAAQFGRLVRETPAGREVRAVVLRDGKRVELAVTPRGGESTVPLGPEFQARMQDLERRLQDRLGQQFNFRLEPREVAPGTPDLQLRVRPELPYVLVRPLRAQLGITPQALTPQLATYFGVKDGVLVAAVRDDSPAARAGVKAGDVITAVNGSTVNDPADITRALGRAGEAEKVSLSIVRDRKTQTIEVPLEGGRGNPT